MSRDEAIELLMEAREILGSSVTYPDPAYQAEVEALGDRIGYGALLHAANYGWQQYNKRRGSPQGSEFVLGSSASTTNQLKTKIDKFFWSLQRKGSDV